MIQLSLCHDCPVIALILAGYIRLWQQHGVLRHQGRGSATDEVSGSHTRAQDQGERGPAWSSTDRMGKKAGLFHDHIHPVLLPILAGKR